MRFVIRQQETNRRVRRKPSTNACVCVCVWVCECVESIRSVTERKLVAARRFFLFARCLFSGDVWTGGRTRLLSLSLSASLFFFPFSNFIFVWLFFFLFVAPIGANWDSGTQPPVKHLPPRKREKNKKNKNKNKKKNEKQKSNRPVHRSAKSPSWDFSAANSVVRRGFMVFRLRTRFRHPTTFHSRSRIIFDSSLLLVFGCYCWFSSISLGPVSFRFEAFTTFSFIFFGIWF